MIAKVLVSSKPPTVGLRPIGDSLPRKTWREAARYITPGRGYQHSYPTEGCHGAPLEPPACKYCEGGQVDGGMFGGEVYDCPECQGTRLLFDGYPNRTDMP